MGKILSLVIMLLMCPSSVWTESAQSSEYIGELCYVPSGSFQRDENPNNISRVGSFLMSRYLITSEQFTEVTRLISLKAEQEFAVK